MHPDWFVAMTSTIAVAACALAARERYAALEVRAEALRHASSANAQRETLEKRVRDASFEAARLRGLSLAGGTLPEAPVYVERTAPRDAEELAKLARGLSGVDDVVVADTLGLPFTRELGSGGSGLAALAPAAFGLLAKLKTSGFQGLQVDLETFSAVHVSARPLRGRASSTMLLLRSTSRPASPLIADAVAHAAVREGSNSAAPVLAIPTMPVWESTDRVDRGSPAPLVSLVERALLEEHRALLILEDGQVALSAARQGPSVEARRAAAEALTDLARHAARVLRVSTLARAKVTLDDGRTLAWSALSPASTDAIVSFTDAGAGSGAKLDRLVGSFKRQTELRSAGAPREQGGR